MGEGLVVDLATSFSYQSVRDVLGFPNLKLEHSLVAAPPRPGTSTQPAKKTQISHGPTRGGPTCLTASPNGAAGSLTVRPRLSSDHAVFRRSGSADLPSRVF